MTSDELKTRMREIVAGYPSARSAMLPCLHLAQQEHGYITPEGILAVAEAVGVKPDEVASVVTFYSMLTQEPKGRNVVKVCTSVSCYLRGCDELMAHLEKRLGIRQRETTSDGRFTLEPVECLAACGMAPVLQVNGRFYERVTKESADALIEYLESGGDPEAISSPWRPISDGRGMATASTLGGASESPATQATQATQATPATDADVTQNGAHEQ